MSLYLMLMPGKTEPANIHDTGLVLNPGKATIIGVNKKNDKNTDRNASIQVKDQGQEAGTTQS